MYISISVNPGFCVLITCTDTFTSMDWAIVSQSQAHLEWEQGLLMSIPEEQCMDVKGLQHF